MASQSPCPICLTVYQAVSRYNFSYTEQTLFKMDMLYTSGLNEMPQVHGWGMSPRHLLSWIFELLPMTGADIEDNPRIDCYEAPKHTSDPIVASLVQGWLSDCCTHHSRCGQQSDPSYCPPRLIDVARDHIKLVTTNVFESTGCNVYASLSHCWGKFPAFLTLTRENIDRLHEQRHSMSLQRLSRMLFSSAEDWMCDIFGSIACVSCSGAKVAKRTGSDMSLRCGVSTATVL